MSTFIGAFINWESFKPQKVHLTFLFSGELNETNGQNPFRFKRECS